MKTTLIVCFFLGAAVVIQGRVVEPTNQDTVELEFTDQELTPRQTLSGLETEQTNTAAEVTDHDSEAQTSYRNKRAKRGRQERIPRHCHSWRNAEVPAQDRVLLQEPLFIHEQAQRDFYPTHEILHEQAQRDFYPTHEILQEQVAYSTPVLHATHYREPFIKPDLFRHAGGGFGVPALRPPQIIVRESCPPPVTYKDQPPIILDQPAPVPFVFGRTEPVRLAHHSKPFYIEHFETPVIVDHYQKPVVVNHKQTPVVIDHYQTPQVLEDQLPGAVIQPCDGASSDNAGVETVDVIRPVGPSISYIDNHPAHGPVLYEAYPPVIKEEVVTTNLIHGVHSHPTKPCD